MSKKSNQGQKKLKNPPKKGELSSKNNDQVINEKKVLLNKLLIFLQNKSLHQWIIFLFAFLLYSNSISNKYSVDDSIVIERNMFTKKGLKGMAGIWGKDTFVGFFGNERNLVSGGRYRPLTVAMFALENQLFGKLVKNNNEYNVSTNLVLEVSKKDAVLASLGNPVNKVIEQKKDERKGKTVDLVTINIEIEPGKAIPDKDGDYVYEGNPHISHAINAILFGLLCWILYLWLLMMFDPKNTGNLKAVFIAFTAAILFAAHPLHTEAVANIKGRDEIVVTLLSVLATYWTMKSIGAKGWAIYLSAAVLAFFAALFSKESAIPFLVIIPAAIYFFQKETDIPTIALRTAPFLVAVMVFWFGIRNPILNWPGKSAPAPELMNDPFMKLSPTVNNQRSYVPFTSEEKNGMILYTWLEYIKLLAVPYPLTNDYYPKHIGVEDGKVKPSKGNNITELKDENGKVRYIRDDIPTLSSPMVLLSILIHLAMAALAIFGLMKRKPYAFALLFYAATFSVVSNLFFPIGTLMAERFMFMPSISFSMLCAMGLAQFALDKDGHFSLGKIKMPLAVFTSVTIVYSVITFDRNFDWYNDYTLFTSDIPVSKNSAKLNNAVSGVLQDKAGQASTPMNEKESLYKKALIHSTNAINIHPTYNNAWLLYGNANVFLGNIREAEGDSLKKLGNAQTNNKYSEALQLYTEGLKAYNEVNRLRPDHPDVPVNLTAAYRTRGKLYGEKLGNIQEALKDLEQSNQWGKDKDVEVLRLLGVAYGITGIMNAQQGNLQGALSYHSKAVESLEKALTIAPKYVPTMFNLEVAYREIAKLDASKLNEYLSKAEELNKKWKEIDPNYSPGTQK